MSETATPRPESAHLDCPKCHISITYYDVAGSEFYACPNCHAYFKYSGEEKPKIRGTYQKAPPRAPVIPLGALGTLDGRTYRLVGVAERHEAKHPEYKWREYQLFQPETASYAQLAEFDGHWTLIWADIENAPDSELFRLTDFKTYNKYRSAINWALGEFDWDIEGDKNLNVTEYIRPPYLLVQEQRGQQRQWYRGRHMEPQALATAFGLSSSAFPAQQGVGAVQPAPGQASWRALRVLTFLVVGGLLLAQMVLSLRPHPMLLNETLGVVADTTAAPGTGKVIVSPTFVLDHQTALQIDLTTTLSNQWLELPVSVVNEDTGQGFEFTKNIEFYSGVESGESWSEGSRSADAVLSRVPAGRYHLNFYPFSEKGVPPKIQVQVQAVPAITSNLLVVLLLVLLYPGIQFMRQISYESSRW